MRNYIINLFKINNLSSVDFTYKLVDVNLRVKEVDDKLRYNKQLQKAALKVSSESGGPSAIVTHNGKKYIAIASENGFETKTINVAPHNVTVSVLPEVYTVNTSTATKENINVIFKFLDFAIRKNLSKSGRLWKLNSSQFFSKKTAKIVTDSSIGIYEGFWYKLVQLGDGQFYVCLDLNSKYIDTQPLSRTVNVSNSATIGDVFKGRRFLYLNGENWYATELMGFGEVIGDQEIEDFDGNGITVYDYIMKYAKDRLSDLKNRVKKTDLTMIYKYPGRSMEPHSGSCSLAKMIYSPHDKEVQSLHSFSIKDPERRFESIQRYIADYFGTIQFKASNVSVSTEPLGERLANFPLAELKFNNDKSLNASHYSTGGTSAVRDFARDRKRLLLSNGILNADAFDEQFLIVPDTLERGVVEAFKRNIEAMIKKIAPQFNSFRIVRYPVKSNVAATFQVVEIEKALEKANALSGFALFVLPDLTFESRKRISNFHDCLKNKFYPNLKIQCASGYKIKSFFESYPSVGKGAGLFEFRVPEDRRVRFESYIHNLSFEHLIVNRKWAYALQNDLHYDIYIGIDVHERQAGFTFFFRNGEHIFFFPEKVPLKNRSQTKRSERLTAKFLRDILLRELKKHIPNYCTNPNGIVIIRDGRSFGDESIALHSIIEELDALKLVDKSKIKYGVVDLHKQSAVPLRISAQITGGNSKLENPIAGAYKIINECEGFIFNTGFPFQIRGTAKPLNLILTDGNVDFKNVLQDVFNQTLLAFSSPDRSNSLPVTIKLIDTLLEPLTGAIEIIDDEEDEMEDSPIEGEELTN